MKKQKITRVWVDDIHVYAMTETGLTPTKLSLNDLNLQIPQKGKGKISTGYIGLSLTKT